MMQKILRPLAPKKLFVIFDEGKENSCGEWAYYVDERHPKTTIFANSGSRLEKVLDYYLI